MYSAYLYGCECWWKIDAVAPTILADERKLLKRILHCKSNTPSNIIYVELNRCDIITKIKYRQYLFYNKFKHLNPNDSAARNILDLCSRLDIFNYYEHFQSSMVENAKTEMKMEITNSTSTYNQRYNDITGCLHNNILYNEYLNENKIIIISRWRLFI